MITIYDIKIEEITGAMKPLEENQVQLAEAEANEAKRVQEMGDKKDETILK